MQRWVRALPAARSKVVYAGVLLGIACLLAQPDARGASVAFVDVNVVPMDSERVLRHQTVLVDDATIVGVGPTHEVKVPTDATQISGSDNIYVLPGLADMHTHIEDPNDLVLYSANGVTTVLQMGGPTYLDMNRIRQQHRERGVVGPEFFSSFLIDGPSSRGGPFAATPSDAREMVRMAQRLGYEFIKVYNHLSREQFIAIIDESKQHGLAVVGHGVPPVGLPAALFSGQAMVAHAEELYYTAFGRRADESLIPSVVAEIRRSGGYVTPNLSAYVAIAEQWGKPQQVRKYLADPRAMTQSPAVRMGWMRDSRQRRTGEFENVLPFLRKLTKAMQDGGVPLLMGTDSPPVPGLYAGYSVHDDFRELREAGLTNYEALVAATRTPGQFIAKHVPSAKRFGEIRESMHANILVVEGNPLESLDVLKRPIGVMTAGRWIAMPELEAIIEQQQSSYRSLY